MRSSQVCVVAVCLFGWYGFAMGQGASQQEVFQKPTWEPGAVYTVRSTQPFTGVVHELAEHTVTSMTGDKAKIQYVSMKGVSSSRVYDVANQVFTSGQRTGDLKAIRYPTFVGDMWDYSYTIPMPGYVGSFLTFNFSAKVAGWEEVTVPSGTFRVLKIEHNGTWTNSGSRRTGNAKAAYWYSPETKRFVKEWGVVYGSDGTTIVDAFERQLMKYQPAPDMSNPFARLNTPPKP